MRREAAAAADAKAARTEATQWQAAWAEVDRRGVLWFERASAAEAAAASLAATAAPDEKATAPEARLAAASVAAPSQTPAATSSEWWSSEWGADARNSAGWQWTDKAGDWAERHLGPRYYDCYDYYSSDFGPRSLLWRSKQAYGNVSG